MAATLPMTTAAQFIQSNYRRPSTSSSVSPPQSSPVSSEKLVTEIIKKLLQLQLAKRIEGVSQEGCYSDESSQLLSPSRQLNFSCCSDQSPQSALSSRSLYKTEICRRFVMNQNSTCEYGIRCRFAHGLKELHLTARHPRYKTELCRAYQLTGVCRYGRRCDFIHDESPYELEILRTENALYQEYCVRHPCVKQVTLVEVLREFAPSRPELRNLLHSVEKC